MNDLFINSLSCHELINHLDLISTNKICISIFHQDYIRSKRLY